LRPLPASEVHLWYRLTGPSGTGLAICQGSGLLGGDERERLAALRRPEDRRDYLAAHLLLRTTLSRYAPVAPGAWRLDHDRRGKPRAPQAPWIEFNLTHTNGLVACALARRTVGLDAEWLGQDLDAALAAEFLTPAELTSLTGLPTASRARRLLTLWTLKEAYAKALGLGLALPMQGFGVHLSPHRPPRLRCLPRDARAERAWTFFALNDLSPAHRVALVVRRPAQGPVRLVLHRVRSGPAGYVRPTPLPRPLSLGEGRNSPLGFQPVAVSAPVTAHGDFDV
jgi:4'-phosphopantetheinyl transferase